MNRIPLIVTTAAVLAPAGGDARIGAGREALAQTLVPAKPGTAPLGLRASERSWASLLKSSQDQNYFRLMSLEEYTAPQICRT